MCTAMHRCQSLVTFSVILQLRSVSQYINCTGKQKQTARRGRLGRNGLLFSMATFSISLLLTALFPLPVPQGKQREDSRCPRRHQPPRTAAQRTASAAHRARPAPAAAPPNPGHGWEQRRALGTAHSSSSTFKGSVPLLLEKMKRGFSKGVKKKKKGLIFFWGSHCVCECVNEHTMHGWTQPVGSC